MRAFLNGKVLFAAALLLAAVAVFGFLRDAKPRIEGDPREAFWRYRGESVPQPSAEQLRIAQGERWQKGTPGFESLAGQFANVETLFIFDLYYDELAELQEQYVDAADDLDRLAHELRAHEETLKLFITSLEPSDQRGSTSTVQDRQQSEPTANALHLLMQMQALEEEAQALRRYGQKADASGLVEMAAEVEDLVELHRTAFFDLPRSKR